MNNFRIATRPYGPISNKLRKKYFAGRRKRPPKRNVSKPREFPKGPKSRQKQPATLTRVRLRDSELSQVRLIKGSLHVLKMLRAKMQQVVPIAADGTHRTDVLCGAIGAT